MADDEEFADVGSSPIKKKERPVRRLTVRECDLPSEMANEIVEYAQQAMDDQTIQKNMAQHVKITLDKQKGGTWHVITGQHFGGNVTNDAGTLINFSLDNTWFFVFRSGPPEKKNQFGGKSKWWYREFLETSLLFLPFEEAWRILARFDNIQKWGCAVVKSSYIENGFDACAVGAIRCSILHNGGKERVAIREKLLGSECTAQKAIQTYSALACDSAPFPKPVHNIVTTITLTPVTNEVERCFVEMASTFSCISESDTEVVANFLSIEMYKPLLSCFAEYCLADTYALDDIKEDVYHVRYRQYEEKLLEMSLTEGLEKPTDHYERLFVSWIACAREVRQKDGMLKQLQSDFEELIQVAEDATEKLRNTELLLPDYLALVEGIDHDEASNADPYGVRTGANYDVPAELAAPYHQLSAERLKEIREKYKMKQTGTSNSWEGQKPLMTEEEQTTTAGSPNPAKSTAESVARSALYSGCAVTEEQLQEAFQDLDIHHRGFIPVDHLEHFWLNTDALGIPESARKEHMQQWVGKNCKTPEKGMDYEEFVVFMLQLAQK